MSHALGLSGPVTRAERQAVLQSPATWSSHRLETFYIAPLGDPACVTTTNGSDSTACAAEKRPGGNKAPCGLADPKTCSALHFAIPGAWTAPGFDDASWVSATVYPPADVTSTPGYVRHAALFGRAEFIWTRNLLLDNVVLARHTVRTPAR